MNLSVNWLKSCSYCNAINRADALICPSCNHPLEKKKRVGNYNKPLKDEQYEKIIELYNIGWSFKEIAEEITNEKYSDECVRPGGRAHSIYSRISFIVQGRSHRKKYFHRINKNRREIKELRFLHKFNKKYEIEGDCWIWKGATDQSGATPNPVMNCFYKKIMVRRYSYEKVYGSLQKDQIIILTCSNHLCVNPKHLKKISKIEFQIEQGERLKKIGFLANRKKVELIEVQTGKNIFFSSIKDASSFLKSSRDMIKKYNNKSKPFKGYFIKC